MPSPLSSLINLSNSIIGVSLLTMPYCFQQCGILLAFVILVLSAVVNKFACHLLLKASLLTRRRKLEFLAYQTLGYNGKLLIEIALISFLLGGCVALFVVAGDLLPSLLGAGVSQENRVYLMVFLAVFGALPLALRRNTESLTSFSMVSMLFYVILAFKMFTDSLPALINGSWFDKVVWWNTDNLTAILPIFAMALAGQPLVFEVFDLSLIDIHHMRSCDRTVSSAMKTCLTVYTVVGFCGYVASHDRTTPLPGNSLLLLDDTWLSWIFKLGFVVSLIMSYPLCLFPCRTSLHSIIYRRSVKLHDVSSSLHDYLPENRFKFLTIFLLIFTLGAALVIPRIELFLGVTGATIGCAVCIVAPAGIFLGASNKHEVWERLKAQGLIIFGLSIMALCSFSILHRLNQPVEFHPVNSPLPSLKPFPELPIIAMKEKVVANIESLQNDHPEDPVIKIETMRNHTGDVKYQVDEEPKASVKGALPDLLPVVQIEKKDPIVEEKKGIQLLEKIAEEQQEQKKMIEDIQKELKQEIAMHKESNLNMTADVVNKIEKRFETIDANIDKITNQTKVVSGDRPPPIVSKQRPRESPGNKPREPKERKTLSKLNEVKPISRVDDAPPQLAKKKEVPSSTEKVEKVPELGKVDQGTNVKDAALPPKVRVIPTQESLSFKVDRKKSPDLPKSVDEQKPSQRRMSVDGKRSDVERVEPPLPDSRANSIGVQKKDKGMNGISSSSSDKRNSVYVNKETTNRSVEGPALLSEVGKGIEPSILKSTNTSAVKSMTHTATAKDTIGRMKNSTNLSSPLVVKMNPVNVSANREVVHKEI